MLTFDSIEAIKEFFFSKNNETRDFQIHAFHGMMLVGVDLPGVEFDIEFESGCLKLIFESVYEEAVFDEFKEWGMMVPNDVSPDKSITDNKTNNSMDDFITYENETTSSITLSDGSVTEKEKRDYDIIVFNSTKSFKEFFFRTDENRNNFNFWVEEFCGTILIKEMEDIIFDAKYTRGRLKLTFDSLDEEVVFNEFKEWGMMVPNDIGPDDYFMMGGIKNEMNSPMDDFITREEWYSSITLSQGSFVIKRRNKDGLITTIIPKCSDALPEGTVITVKQEDVTHLD